MAGMRGAPVGGAHEEMLEQAGMHVCQIRINGRRRICLHRQTGPLGMRAVVDGQGKEG